MSAEEAVRVVDGISTYSRSAGSGPDVVLIHGAGVSTAYWEPALRSLAGSGRFRVHSLDLPGFGRSGEPRWPLELPNLAEHVHRWLEEAGIGACHLVGQSLGCEIAALLAVRYPASVRSVSLVAPAGLPELHSVTQQLLLAAVDAPREPLALYGAILPAYWRCGLARLLHMLLEQKRHPSDWLLPEITQPALVVHGARDPLVSERRLNAVARAIPNARTATIPGAHGAHFSHPEELVRVLLAFLEN